MIQSIKQMVLLSTVSSGGVYESAQLNENLDGTGGITVSWNAAENVTLPVGLSITVNGTKYSLLDPYSPTRNSPQTFRYEPTFQHPLARLSRVPFYLNTVDSERNAMELHTISYTGLPRTIVQYLVDFFTKYGEIDDEFNTTFNTTPWTYDLGSGLSWNELITVDFDGCPIRAAATRIADAIGCNVFFDWPSHVIRFIAGTTLDGETYNCFRVLGGTRNMAKKTVSGSYAAVTQRLTLKESGQDAYPGSMMKVGDPAILLTRDLIFDDIYPKMELYIRTTRPRYCYLTDENGDKIVDHMDGDTPVYKQYCKWYVTLEDAAGNQYLHDSSSGSSVVQIDDKPLGLLFQPDYTNTTNTCPLAGRQFEVVYFPNATQEWEEDDVLAESTPFEVHAGEFRIIFTAEGSTILPTLPSDKLIPKAPENGSRGNKVTLVNVALGDTFKEAAQEELRLAALDVIALMDNDSGQYSREVADYKATGEQRVVGRPYEIDGHAGVITNVSADLDTGVANITVGSWARKSLTGGVRDKIDAVTTSVSNSDMESVNFMNKNQFDTLMRTVKKGSSNTAVINGLVHDVEAIKNQSDAQMHIIFGRGNPTTAENPPEDAWETDEEKRMHLYDTYYDQNREPASTGGRAWRWMFHAAGSTGDDGTYYNYDTWQWEEITDMDTLLSLEKIADVASDGILTGGTEKSHVFVEWKSAADEYQKLMEEARNYDVATERDTLSAAYWALWRMLNGGVANTDGVYNSIPSWLSSLTTSTAIGNFPKPNGQAMDADFYRQTWSDFYAAYSALSVAINGKNRLLIADKKSFYVSHLLPSAPYNLGDMWLKTSSANSTDGELYTCVNACPTGGTPAMGDWKRLSNFGVSLTNLLATIYIKCESEIKRMFAQTGNPQFLLVQIGGQSSYTAYTIFYDTDYYSSGQARLYFGGVDSDDNPVGYNSPLFDDYATLKVFEELYRILGECQLYIWKELSGSANLYDICGKRGSFTDSFTKQTVEGELAVWVHGETAWMQVIENTEGILQNYGDHIVAAIYGVDAATAQSMSTNLTLAKNFAQLMAQAGSDTSDTMKDVAGIRIVADEHEDPNDDTTPITKGHVEIVGDLVSADGTVKIGNNSWDGGGNYGQRYGLEISDDRNTDIIIKSDWTYNSRIPTWTYEPYIALTSKESSPSTLISSRSLMTAKYIASPVFKIIRVVRTASQDFNYQEINGVGDSNNPITFVAKDSNGNDVTVTVMGGIITDIS